ncbi:MAG: hypothetical protein IJS15_10760 [Victivallales bacterium]|nr:hypothetical protein [Victivallales bacterium]
MKKSIGKMLMALAVLLLAQVVVAADATLSVFSEGTTSATLLKQAGEKFYVDINLSNPGEGTNLTHIMAILKWDPAVLTFTEYKVPTAVEGVQATGEYAVSDAIKAKGVLVVGLDGFFSNISQVKGPFNGPIAQIGFQVAEDAVAGDTPIDLQLSFDLTILDGVLTAAEINEVATNVVEPPVTDADGNEIDTTCEGATGEVVKLFNVSSYETTLDDGWTSGNFYQIPLGINVSYTNEEGDAYSTEGGRVTAIDTANITLKVGTDAKGYEAKEYTAAKFGEFKWLSNNKGTVYWDGKVTEVIGHNNLVFVIPFTATSSDDKYTDTNTLTMTVVPANSEPVVSNFTIVKDGDYAMMETKKVKFTFKITDADGDETEPVAGSVKLNGDALAGTFANDNGVWSFTGSDSLDQDLVAHTVTDKNDDGVHVLAWNITFNVTDGIATVASTQSSGDDKADWILDVDREQTAPTSAGFTPAAPTTTDDITAAYGDATDADGDEITYSVIWSNGNKTYTGETLPAAQTAKGDVWTPAIYATTTPYGKDVTTSVVGDDVTIQNTAPTLAAAVESIFIRKGEATTGVVEFTITDADTADEFTVTANGVKGTTEASAVADGKFTVTYTVTDTTTEFTDGSFTVKVNDRTDDSNEVTVAVSFRDNPPPVIEDGESEFKIDEVDADKQASTLELTVNAYDSTEVAPYGIKSIAWSITDGDGIEIASDATKTNTADGTGNYPETDEFSVTIRTKGYDTLTGKDRAASADYKLKVTVTDAMGVATEKEFKVTVNDVDRVATAPTSLGLAEGTLHTGDTIATNPEGAEDADGDDVSYRVVLSVGGEEVANDYAVKKGDVVTVKAVATSKAPYEEEAKDGGELTATLEPVANTAPVITVPDGDGAVAIDEFVDGYNEADATLTIGADADVKFAYTDIDADAGVDAVTVTVDGAGLAGYATADIVDGKLVITREPNVNTVGLAADELPYFTVIATDDSEEAAEAKFYLTINQINTKPVVEVSDIYVTPDKAEFEQTFPVTSFGLSADEADQTIAAIVDTVVEDEAGLLEYYRVIKSDDNKSVIVKGGVNQNAAPGSEAVIKFKVQDDGGTPYEDTSDELSVKVSIGSTPWYPVVTVPCNEHEMHQVTLTNAADASDSVTLIVEGDTIYPADFYNQGCKGLKSGATYTVKCWAWTPEDGAAAEECGEAGELNVVAYDQPGKATVEVADGSAANKKKIGVKAPLASKYTVTIKRDGSVYKTVKKDFTPDENGFITPSAEFELELPEGSYEVTAFGTNPDNNDGEVSDAVEFEIAGAEPALEWPDGAFTPDGEIKYIAKAAKNATVRFNWPVVSGATGYILCIESIAGNISKEIEVAANSYEYTFSGLGEQTDVSWWVIAKNANDEVSSDSFAFSIVRLADDNAIILGASAEDDDTLGFKIKKPHENVKVFTKADVQLAHIENGKVTWYTAKNAAVTEVDDETVTVDIDGEVAAGDIVYIRPSTSGASEWSVFSVK